MGSKGREIFTKAETSGNDVPNSQRIPSSQLSHTDTNQPKSTPSTTSNVYSEDHTTPTSPDGCDPLETTMIRAATTVEEEHQLRVDTEEGYSHTHGRFPLANSENQTATDSRDPDHISLAIGIDIVQANTSTTSTNITIPASKCSSYRDLRVEVAGASYKHAQATDFSNVSFRLEEDGQVASMTIAPTKIDGLTPFPEKTYDAWFYRITRGKQDVYRVDVKVKL